jgi:hypothetical protein
MAGFKNDSNNHEILIADNVNFSGDNTPVGKVVSDGQLLIGSSVFPFIVPGLLGSSDGSITWTLGHNTITGQVAGGTSVLKTLTGNSGGVISPTAGNINTLGTGSITISGAGSTLTTQLTGLTANSVLYGLGTATIGLVASGTSGQVLQTNTGAAPTYSTATYPSTTTINQVLYSSAANTITGITAANNGLLITGTTGVPSILANGTTGQVLAATTSNPPSWVNSSSVGGSLVLISQQSASNIASISFTNLATYSVFMLLAEQARPITAGDNVLLQISTNNGSTYITSGYLSGFNATPYNSTSQTNTNLSSSFILAANVNNSGVPACIEGQYWLYSLAAPHGNTCINGKCTFNNASNIVNLGVSTGVNTNSSSVNAIKIFCTSSNLFTGVFTLYGVVGS